MCRILGYLGAPRRIDEFLSKPSRSLCEQGKTPRELPPGMIGSDGYGFGFHPPGDEARAPARYRTVLPMWADENLDTLAPHLVTRCLVASTRTATRDMPVCLSNTPPFGHGRLTLVHNGSIERFHERVMLPLRALLSPDSASTIVGNSDSEHIAALLADTPGETLSKRLSTTLVTLKGLLASLGASGQLNLVVSDGEELCAVRSALGDAPPSLHHRISSGGTVVASEPIDDDGGFVSFTPETMLSVRQGESPTLSSLDR